MVKLQVVYRKVEDRSDSYGVALCLVRDVKRIVPSHSDSTRDCTHQDVSRDMSYHGTYSDFQRVHLDTSVADKCREKPSTEKPEKGVLKSHVITSTTLHIQRRAQMDSELSSTTKGTRACCSMGSLSSQLSLLCGCSNNSSKNVTQGIPNRPDFSSSHTHLQGQITGRSCSKTKTSLMSTEERGSSVQEKCIKCKSPSDCSDDSAICLQGGSNRLK